jgi:hypothetical protein
MALRSIIFRFSINFGFKFLLLVQTPGATHWLRWLRKLILELISVAMSDNPSATPAEIEQQVRHHLERMARP